jgi:hypothetical protein
VCDECPREGWLNRLFQRRLGCDACNDCGGCGGCSDCGAPAKPTMAKPEGEKLKMPKGGEGDKK